MAMAPGTLHQGDLNLWEYAATLLTLIAACFVRRMKRVIPPPAPRHSWRAAVYIGLLTLALRAALLPWMPVPVPGVHDEYSYLLQADTFAHGRLSNPTHPMWRHFESIHIFHQPTYQSMYPPLQGLILAAGKLLGHPWISVWLSCGLMVGALLWMLYGYLPPRWAMLGGLIAMLHYGLIGYWMNSYWGGAHAAIGGSLVLGALPRLRDSWRNAWPYAAAVGAGLAILANSRPFEGLLFAVGVLFTLNGGRPWRDPAPALAMLRRTALPASLVLLLAASGMAVYFNAVTGSPLRMPYQVNRATYGWPMTQFWLPTAAVTPSIHKSMRDYYLWELRAHDQLRSPKVLLNELWSRVRRLWSFFIGPLLTLPLLLFGRRAWRDIRVRGLLPPLLFVLAGVLAGQSAVPHYLAPVVGVIVILMVQAVRRLCLWRIGDRATGLFLAQAVLCLLVVTVAIRPAGIVPMGSSPSSWCCVAAGNTRRAELIQTLSQQAGGQLVMVRYQPDHNFHVEWIYNDADIDAAKIVWAREISPGDDRRLLDYFHDRTVWLLKADADPQTLEPYRR
jgi:hypothetical protein